MEGIRPHARSVRRHPRRPRGLDSARVLPDRRDLAGERRRPHGPRRPDRTRAGRAARGSTARLYVLVCLACALLTATLSLDGAVVVMVPVILALVDLGAPGRPLLLATIGVANAFSIAVVQGNPTNLVVMSGLHLDPGTFDATMIGPGTAAALICAAVVAVREWPRLRGSVRTGAAPALGARCRGRGRRARCGRDRRGGSRPSSAWRRGGRSASSQSSPRAGSR